MKNSNDFRAIYSKLKKYSKINLISLKNLKTIPPHRRFLDLLNAIKRLICLKYLSNLIKNVLTLAAFSLLFKTQTLLKHNEIRNSLYINSRLLSLFELIQLNHYGDLSSLRLIWSHIMARVSLFCLISFTR